MDNAISAANLKSHIHHLCNEIGTRLAGTDPEAAGAEYIAGQFRALGLQTEIQEFPCITWTCREASMKARFGSRWRDVPVQPNTQSPSTPGEIEAELIYLESAQPEDLRGRDLQGRIGLLFGSAYASVERLERLCNSGLAALLYVDDRFPSDWKVASGLIAGWIDLMTIPTATIPYMQAWEIVRQGAGRVRLNLDVETFQSRSQNVVARWPGRAKLAPLVLGAHHDSVALGVGAEDDGSGVAAVLELARICAAAEPLRPINFVTFGWEENLSEGSRQYVVNPANAAAKTALMLNFDSLGSWLGHNECFCVGDASMRRFLTAHLRRQAFVADVRAEVSPFSDQFPFNLLGVPSVWFHRHNFPGGRFYHHSEYDRPDVIDFDQLARTLEVAKAMLLDLAGQKDLPFERAIPMGQQREIGRHRAELFDPICDWRTPDLMRPVERPWRDI